MLATRHLARPLTRIQTRTNQLGLQAVYQPCFTRAYAYSRFPDRRPGTSRTRDRPERLNPRPRLSRREEQPPFGFGFQGFQAEQKPSADESPLWEEASQRVAPSPVDPAEGLGRLLLDNDVLVITRQIEMLNIFVGFEQSNRYVITNEMGDILGYIAEEPRGVLSMFSRQIFRTHRPFRAIVMDPTGAPLLWLRRPFAWINSRMFVQRLSEQQGLTPEGEPILDTFAEVQQKWHMWRRRYELFLRDTPRRILTVASDPQPEPEPETDVLFKQLANVDEGLWAWHFTMRGERGEDIASVNRAFRGFGREIFTDTGQYFVRFGPQPLDPLDPLSQAPSVIRNLTLDERATILALAVNIDFDYFSRHSHGGGFGMPFFFFAAGE